MPRTPEPELMDDAEQAEAYAAADFEAVNELFVARCLAALGPFAGRLVDLGCGPGDIAAQLAAALPKAQVVGIDGSPAMLAHAARWARPNLSYRVGRLPGCWSGQPFDAVVSNSLLHHLHDPAVLWTEIVALARPGATVIIADLLRPKSVADAEAIVAQYAGSEREILRRDFLCSLHAAFTVSEVEQQLERAGLNFEVKQISDRHLAATGTV